MNVINDIGKRDRNGYKIDGNSNNNVQVPIVFDPTQQQQQQPPLLVEADKTRIFEVLSNLLNNAIKFTKEGKIEVSTWKEKDGNSVIVRVKDSGKGIDAEIIPRLFTKFTTRSETGTGLGLYISKS